MPGGEEIKDVLWAWSSEKRPAASAAVRLGKANGAFVEGCALLEGSDRLGGSIAEAVEEFCLRDLARCFLEGMIVLDG